MFEKIEKNGKEKVVRLLSGSVPQNISLQSKMLLHTSPWGRPGTTYWRGRFRTVHLLIKVACFVETVNNIFYIKTTWSKLMQGGQPYRAFPFSKAYIGRLMA
jgi:hypothetical protein